MTRTILANVGPRYATADPDDSYHEPSEVKQLARDKRDVLLTYPVLMEADTLVLKPLGKRAASNWRKDVITGTVPHINLAPWPGERISLTPCNRIVV